ncbi:SusC/RagA family TonB-linked outer membrane protein [Flavitalea sp. BT771]|uniref:SusC/RagA family TonB-linked outer membrane protein n=1 Tax=Flavitalea sp. BT771 TaxID=3063329 RepID=UPI0026E474B8|nr:SusC/RagA family TonB-linked outer membrane protein [Flavitalea sp. BT771]MDO6434762.1 SusC/RagA family TonB-linked outer membrane protein [Flavitalea sp. BT771]MDV6223662.1 SusC/RagA family TonB-linked outer membrane protein [Flavitalea sp. BT771]
MRLTSILLLGACLQVSARVHSQTVSFSGRNVPLEKIFAAVEKQTGYVFFFDEAILKDARPVTIRAENYSLPLFLNCVLNGQPFKFSFQNKTIVISRTSQPNPAPAPPATDTSARPPSPELLHGVVTDKNLIPLSGASIIIVGTGKSTLTDGHGAFSIPASARKSKLIVSYVGYTNRQITLSGKEEELYIQLTVAINTMDEEVVQGYGKTSRRLSVANIIQVSGEDIQKQPVMNPLLALNGRVPGMLVTPTSGYVSAPVKVEIRGRNTLDPNQVSDPLYVIDGVPLTILDLTNTSFLKSSYTNGSTGFIQAGLFSNTRGQSPLFSINPADIESVTVLKDAAATAIYGSRGANGVILITTKKAQPGATSLQMSVQQSTSSVPRHWKMLNTPQYLQMRREALKNDGLPLTAANAPDLVNWDTTRYTDWQKKIWGVAKSTNASISLSGGDRITSFIVSAGYNRSQDITTLKGTNQRISLSSGLIHHSLDQRLTVDLRATYGYTYVDAITMPGLSTLAPNTPPIFDDKGNLNYKDWNEAGVGDKFLFAGILQPTSASSHFLNGGLNVNYILAKGLKLGIQGGFNHATTTSANYTTIASQNPLLHPMGFAGFGNSAASNWNIEPQLNYAFYIGNGKLDCMAGGSMQGTISRGTTIGAFGYTNDALLHSPSNAMGSSSSSNEAQTKFANIHGRINYNWENKYILELSGNRDGSSNFGPGRQYGNFWAIGGAWIASEEPWMKRVLPSWWSFFKLNASYGITGHNGGGAYQYLSQWSTPAAYLGSPPYNGIVPLVPVHAVNQDYQWQSNRKINTDITLGFLKDRINLTVTYYRDRCNNQLVGMPTPAFTGFTSVTANSPANVQNTGWEGIVKAKVVASKNFSWSVDFNIGINRNKLLSYPDFEFSPYYTTYKIGKSINAIYVLHYLGINPLNGQPGYADYNHDGTISTNANVPAATGNDDRYIAIDITPRYSGGINSMLTYKRCMLTLFFNFKKQLGQIPFTDVPGNMGNIPADVFNDHWQKPGDQSRYPRFSTVGSQNDSYLTASDGAYTDASYLRLNNLVFSYSLPENICKKAHMQGVNLSVNMSNVFTITSYKGIDPEVTTSFGYLPSPRIIAGSISLNF